jgi:hypothetical protein
MDQRLRRHIYWSLTILGTATLCVAVRSWREPYHCVYDVLTGLVVFSFVAQLVTDALEGGIGREWWGRALLLVPIAGASAGALLLGWEISGHLTGLLIVAGAQSVNERLSIPLRIAYWLPVPIGLWLRWGLFDRGVHTETYSAVAVAAICLGAVLAWRQMISPRPPSPINH